MFGRFGMRRPLAVDSWRRLSRCLVEIVGGFRSVHLLAGVAVATASQRGRHSVQRRTNEGLAERTAAQ